MSELCVLLKFLFVIRHPYTCLSKLIAILATFLLLLLLLPSVSEGFMVAGI